MRQGDEVVAVDGSSVADLNPFEVATLIATAPQPRAATPPDSTAAITAAAVEFSTGAEARAPGAAAPRDAAQPAEDVATVRVVHDDGAAEDVLVARGRAAPARNPVSAKMARGGRGFVQLRTFNNRAVPEIRVRRRCCEQRRL